MIFTPAVSLSMFTFATHSDPMSNHLYFRLSGMFFLQFFVWGSWFVTLGTYLLQTLEFSGRQVGLVYGATAIAATMTPFFLGMLADRFFSVEKMLSLLHFAGGLMMIAVSWLDRFVWFYPALIGYALLYVPTFSLSSALAFHHLPDASRDFPRVRVWGTIGWIVAGLVVGFLRLEADPFPMRISAVSSFALGFFCLMLPNTPPKGQAVKRRRGNFMGPEILVLLRERSFALLVFSLTLISIPSSFYYSFVNPFLNELGVENAAGKMSLGQVTEIFMMLLLPFFFSRLGFKWVITIGLFTWGARYAFFAFGTSGPSVWMLYVGILLHGVAYNFTFLAAQIYVDRRVPVHVRSTAQGFIALVTIGLGALIGAFIAGDVVAAFSLPGGEHHWPAIWRVPAVTGLLVTVIFALRFSPATGRER